MLLLAAAVPASATIWIDSSHLENIAKTNNVTTRSGKIFSGWDDEVKAIASVGSGSIGQTLTVSNYVDYVEIKACSNTGTSQFIFKYKDLNGVEHTLDSVYISESQYDCGAGKYTILDISVNDIATEVSWTSPQGTEARDDYFKAYGRDWLPNAYIETVEINKDDYLGHEIVAKGSGYNITAECSDGNTYSVTHSTLVDSVPCSDSFKFKVSIDPASYLEYFGVIPDEVYGYVYDSNGNPLKGATVKAIHLLTYSEPSGLSATVTGQGNITIYVYKDGQPYQGAKIRVTNPVGMDVILPGATDANGRLNVTGLDSYTGWDPSIAYTFYAYDLSLNPLTDAFGNQLNITVSFLNGVAQTNPAVIYNTYGKDEEYTAIVTDNGYFHFPELDSSKSSNLYNLYVYDSNGVLVYSEAGIQPPYYIVFGTQGGGGSGGDEDTTQYGNPDSKYITVLDKHTAKINEPITVSVKNTAPAIWETTWVSGAEIYVDGVPTGKKTADWGWLGWAYWFMDKIGQQPRPVATIQISEPGEHWVYAKVGNEYSQATKVTIASQSYDWDGGADSGTYPGTQPDDENCYYKLIYSPQAVKVGGSITFKTVKVCNGEITGAVNSMICIDGSCIGEAKPELVYRFTEAGVFKVKANVNGKWTGEGVVTVYSTTDEFLKDSGKTSGISVTVNVYAADTNRPLSGILVQRLSGSAIVEQQRTDSGGVAVLHPESGETYSVIVSDPSNHYLSQLKEGLSWTASDTLTFYLKPAGDLDGDNSTDGNILDEITHVEVRINGIPEDGVSLPPGTHRISVVDQNGKELADVDIYINGDRVGRTGGWLWGWMGAGLEYAFNEPGEYEILAETPNGLTDTLYVNITNNVNSYMLIGYVGMPGLFGVAYSDSAVVNFAHVRKGMPVRFEVREVAANKPMTDWKAVDNAVIVINGNETGITKPVGGFMGFGAVAAYEHTFNNVGNYTVYAKYGDAKTQTMTVMVTEGEESSGGAVGGLIGEFFGQLAEAYPLTGVAMIDTMLWALIAILCLVTIVGIVIRVVL